MTLGAIEEWIGQPLPEPYRTFLEGLPVERSVGDCVLLYGREIFVDKNEQTEAKTYCPGFVTVGDDSGGQQFVLSLTDGRLSLVDAGAMARDCFHPVADDFGSWLSSGCRFDGDEEEN